MPALLADMIIEKMSNVQWAIVALALFAGIISAFVDNVATVLMVAPVAITIARKLKISPVNSIIAIAISSNLQGAATLVGDTTSILLGGEAHMDFLDFFVYKGKPGLFFVVQAGAVLSAIVLLVLFRKEKEKIGTQERAVVTDYFPSFLLLETIILLIMVSFIPNKLDIANGLICMSLLVIGVVRDMIKNKNVKGIIKTVKEIDYFTLLLLAGLFIVIAGITEAGVVTKISEVFVTGIAVRMGIDPTLLYFGLIVGATIGGNLTPIGASANIAGLGILRKEGYEVKPLQFMKISVPFTIIAVLSGYLLVWLIWK